MPYKEVPVVIDDLNPATPPLCGKCFPFFLNILLLFFIILLSRVLQCLFERLSVGVEFALSVCVIIFALLPLLEDSVDHHSDSGMTLC